MDSAATLRGRYLALTGSAAFQVGGFISSAFLRRGSETRRSGRCFVEPQPSAADRARVQKEPFGLCRRTSGALGEWWGGAPEEVCHTIPRGTDVST